MEYQKRTRTQKAKLNMFFSLLQQGISLICGLIVPRLMIKSFGSEAYGATTSVATFLSYITLLEGGIGAVTRSALYKAFGNKSDEQVGAVIYETKVFYRKIAVAYIIYVIFIASFFKQLSHSSVFSYWYSFGLVIVIALSTFAEYFIGISYSLLLQADQQSYIALIFRIVSTILNTVFIVFLVSIHCDFLIVKLVSSIVFVLRPVFLSLYVKDKYNFIEEKSEENLLKNKGAAIGQHIAWALHNNTDITVITVFMNLSLVSVYSVYYMVVSHMHSLVSAFSTGMEAVFGSMLGNGEKEKLKLTFGYYETLISLLSVSLFTTATVLIIPFIRLYTSGVKDVNYIKPGFAIMLIMSSLLYCMRMPYGHMIIAAGRFKETQFAAYGEALINIITSIILIIKYGLVGVAIGTVLATLFRFIYYVVYLSKHILYRRIIHWIKRMAVNFLTFGLFVYVGSTAIQHLMLDNYLKWTICGGIVAAFISIGVLAVNLAFYHSDVIEIINRGFIHNNKGKKGDEV